MRAIRCSYFFFFFFQAEDGIRDIGVTGVQTCALPISRLTERLQQNLAHAVTLVTAPAGSGKTTFVADFIRTGGHPFVWYQLDHADSDALVFLGYVAHGIKQIVPGFGDATTAYLQEA